MDATARAQRARPKRVGQHAPVGGCMRRILIMMRSSSERSTFFNSLLEGPFRLRSGLLA
jgi:hypothetical protein